MENHGLGIFSLHLFYYCFYNFAMFGDTPPASNKASSIILVLIQVLCCFQHCSGHIMTASFVGRGNQYIQLVKVLYCKLPTIGKQLPTFPHKVWGIELLTSEVGGQCVTTVPPWLPNGDIPPNIYSEVGLHVSWN